MERVLRKCRIELVVHVVVVVVLAATCGASAIGQDRLEQLPGYDQYRETQRQMGRLVSGGRITDVQWSEDGRTLRYREGSNYYSCDLRSGEITEITEDDMASERASSNRGGRGGGRVARGRQSTSAESPDGQWTAIHRDWNLHLKNNESGDEKAITTDGHRQVKYATGSWVYGEELRQTTAMWWSPDSTMIAFYEFDERGVKEFYLTTKLTEINTELYPEAYPKPGAANPIVGLLVHDLETNETRRVPIGGDAEQYVYNVRWHPTRSLLLFNRTNRHQNHLEVVAWNPEEESSHIVVSETQETWQNNSPSMQWLADGKRFIWETEREGWKHYELRHVDGRRIGPITRGEFPCASIVQSDEDTGWVYYTAFSAPNPLHAQLHRARFDGTQATRLTTTNLNHTSIDISPADQYFVARTESIDTPPRMAVYSVDGSEIAALSESDTSAMNGRPQPEMFTFKADDGVTDLYGVLFKPSDFDPNKTYPLLINVYGGPLSQSVSARYRAADPMCEFGIITAQIDNRGTRNRGKFFEGATYLKLGIVDIKDQVDGVKYLAQRDYIDGNRVGISGHSYGGYMAALGILKFPDVFHVAVAGAPVTDWKNYDTIYTERFMRTPQENPDGYAQGSCLTYAEQLKGDLLLVHGMVDDNVHPNNSWQLVERLQRAGKRFSMMFYPNSGHGIGVRSNGALRMEFLVENLVLKDETEDE